MASYFPLIIPSFGPTVTKPSASPKEISPCPPLIEIICPDGIILGAAIIPLSEASETATSMSSGVICNCPILLMVVKPAINVFSALTTALTVP